ncbi:MAG TPA: DNA-deoxyinosine glycosylase [Alphaproteobacteria bacterium]|nr:DNA-deoxyinosine glycosylase [Alphaproteobacteria bacterium]
MIPGFDPIIDKNSRVLILGSFPGPVSLAVQEYYGNKGNDFWRVMGDLLETDMHSMTFEEKKKTLLKNKIALWDVYAQAHRVGSADANFVHVIYNDFASLFEEYPKIKLVLLEGTVPYKSFLELNIDKLFPRLKIYKIHSTSGVNRRLNVKQKADIIRKILLENDVKQ